MANNVEINLNQKEFDLVNAVWTVSFVLSLVATWGYIAYNAVIDFQAGSDVRYLLATPFLAVITVCAVMDLLQIWKHIKKVETVDYNELEIAR